MRLSDGVQHIQVTCRVQEAQELCTEIAKKVLQGGLDEGEGEVVRHVSSFHRVDDDQQAGRCMHLWTHAHMSALFKTLMWRGISALQWRGSIRQQW